MTTDLIRRVLITCPETGESVETVLRMRERNFEALNGEHRFRCTRCGQVHAWLPQDAWLEEVRPRHM